MVKVQRILHCYTLSLCLAFGTALSAQSDTIKFLEEIQVTSFRKSIPVVNTPNSLYQLSSRTVRNGRTRSTPEWMEQAPGVLVQKTNHGGGSVFIRGLTGNQTLLMLDGFRLNNGIFRYGPNQYLNTIDPYLLENAEILKGAGSVQYGSDAIGGTIHLLTRDLQPGSTPDTWKVRGLGKWVSGGMEYTGRPEIEYQNKRVAFSGGFTIRKFGDLLGGASTGFQRPSGYGEHSWDAKIKFKTGRSGWLTVAHQGTQQQNVPVYHKIVLENFKTNHMARQSRKMDYAKWEQWWNDKVLDKLTIGVCRQEAEEDRELQKNGSSMLRQEMDKVLTLGAYAQVNLKFMEGWNAVSGMDFYRDQVKSSRTDLKENTGDLPITLRGLYPDNSQFAQYSLYHLQRLEKRQWVFEAGMRWNGSVLTMNDTALGNVLLKPSAFVWNASAGKKFGSHHFVYLSTNTGFRAPNVDDLGTLGVVDFRFEVPNNSLSPEFSRYHEAGYKWNTDQWQWSTSFWYMHLSDLIVRKPLLGQTRNGYPVYQKENTGTAYLYGYDTEFKWKPSSHWQIKGWWHYTFGQDVSNNDPLRRVPPMMWYLNPEYNAGRWRIGLIYQGADKQTRLAKGDVADNRIPKGGTPAWNVFHTYLEVHWKLLEVQVGGVNLFNEDYKTHGSGIQGQGRSLYVNVKIEW